VGRLIGAERRDKVNDPHVVSLTYSFEPTSSLEVVNAPALPIDSDAFTGHLENGVLTLEPKHHFPDIETARTVSDRFVKAWQISVGLALGRAGFSFQFQRADVIDSNPDPGNVTVGISGIAAVSAVGSVIATRHEYPPPPANFRLTPEGEILWERYRQYQEGRKLLLAMAYFCLTVLVPKGEDRSDAAQRLSIEERVLGKIGELTSERGDKATARKMRPTTRPLATGERAWIEAAVSAIIQHLATAQPGHKLTMADLPPLP